MNMFFLISCEDKDRDVAYQPLSHYVKHHDEAKNVLAQCEKIPPQIDKAKANCFNAETAVHLGQ